MARDYGPAIAALAALLTRDFYTLSAAEVERVLYWADEYGYRKPRQANGSRGRYFHALLQRRRGRS